MDLDYAKRMVDHYKKRYGIRGLSIQAEGEVLLYKNYHELVLYAKDSGFSRLSMTTNGTVLDRHADFVLEHLRNISISIDGYDSDTYVTNRGTNEKHFNRVINNVKLLVSKRKGLTKPGPGIFIACVIGKFNVDYLEPMIKLSEELEVDKIRFAAYHPTDGNTDELAPLYYGDYEVEKRFSEIMSRTDYTVDITLPSLYGNRKEFKCSQLFDGIIVGARGSFSPCCHVAPDDVYGNYNNDPNDFNNGELVTFRKEFHNAKRLEELPTICRQCTRLSPERWLFNKQTRIWEFQRQ
jgi:MoaA/NifB/PqqE/SkfB family radical SAM enzyme